MRNTFIPEKKCEEKDSVGDRAERRRIYKMLPIFGKGKVKLNSHTGKKKNQANHEFKKA